MEVTEVQCGLLFHLHLVWTPCQPTAELLHLFILHFNHQSHLNLQTASPFLTIKHQTPSSNSTASSAKLIFWKDKCLPGSFYTTPRFILSPACVWQACAAEQCQPSPSEWATWHGVQTHTPATNGKRPAADLWWPSVSSERCSRYNQLTLQSEVNDPVWCLQNTLSCPIRGKCSSQGWSPKTV